MEYSGSATRPFERKLIGAAAKKSPGHKRGTYGEI